MDGVFEVLQRMLYCDAVRDGREDRRWEILRCLQCEREPDRLEIRHKSNRIVPA